VNGLAFDDPEPVSTTLSHDPGVSEVDEATALLTRRTALTTDDDEADVVQDLGVNTSTICYDVAPLDADVRRDHGRQLMLSSIRMLAGIA
jgi:hypothetical protein